MIIRIYISVFLCCIAALNSFSQTRTVTFLNQKDNTAVTDVFVFFQRLDESDEKKQKFSALTNENGIVQIPFEGDAAIRISHLGFKVFSDTIKAGESPVIYLQPSDVSVDQVVITAQYTPDDPRNSVYAVHVIKQERIEQQGANNLKDVLSQETNIRIGQDNVLGSSVSMQGLSGEQIKIMVDGVPVIGRVNGNIDISQMNLNNTQRIEIIEGPMSVQYGTNALGGVVNLITDYKKMEGVNARVNGYYESAGVYNADAGIGFGKKNHYVDLSGGRYFFDGYSEIDTSRNMEWNPKEQYFGTLKYGYGFKRLQFTVKGDAFYEKITNRGESRSPYNVTAFDDFYYTNRYNGSASVRGEILENHYLDQIVAYNYYRRIKNTFFKDLTTLDMTMTPNAGDQDTARFDAYLLRGFVSRNKPDKIFNYQMGYDINIETGEGKRIEGDTKMIGDYAVFTSFNIKPVDALALQAAVRWSYNTEYRAPLTPAFHLRWKPIEQLVVRTSYARGFRAPSLKELYLDFVDINHNIQGNTDLQAEHSHNVSASLDYVRKTNEHHVRFVPSFFFNDIRDMITLAQYGDANEYTYTNIEHYQTLGGEFTIGYSFKKISLDLGTGLIGRKSSDEDAFNFTPDFSAQANYSIPKAEITVSIFNKFNGRQNFFLTNEIGELSQQTMGAYNLLDISLNRKFWKNKISVTAGVKNLLDVNNVTSTGSTGAHSGNDSNAAVAWGRTFFASLKLNFSKT